MPTSSTLEPTRAAAGSPTPSARAPMQDGNLPKHTLKMKSDEMYQVPLLMLCCSPEHFSTKKKQKIHTHTMSSRGAATNESRNEKCREQPTKDQ